MNPEDGTEKGKETIASDKSKKILAGTIAGKSVRPEDEPIKNSPNQVLLQDVASAVNEALKSGEAQLVSRIINQIEETLKLKIQEAEGQLRESIWQIADEILRADDMEAKMIEAVESYIDGLFIPGMKRDNNLRDRISSIVDDILKNTPLVKLVAYVQSSTSTQESNHYASQRKARVSATVDQETFNRVRGLGGPLSQHLQKALAMYLEREGDPEPEKTLPSE